MDACVCGLLQLAVGEVVDDDAEVVELADGDFHVAADSRLGRVRGLVGLFDGNDAAIGPGGLWDGTDGVAEGVRADVEFLAASADGTKHTADADGGGVGVGKGDVELQHAGLDGEQRILPAVEAVDGHIGVLGGGRNSVKLFALGFDLCTLL